MNDREQNEFKLNVKHMAPVDVTLYKLQLICNFCRTSL